MPSRVYGDRHTRTKVTLLMILCTSSWTSRIVKAELARQAFNAVKASVSRSFFSSSSPSLFLTKTSLINTRSSSNWLSECACPFSYGFDDSFWLSDRDAEHRSGEFATVSDWVRANEAEQRRGSLLLYSPSKSEAAKWTFWFDATKVDSEERILSELSSWESEFLVLMSAWEKRGDKSGDEREELWQKTKWSERLRFCEALLELIEMFVCGSLIWDFDF